MPGTSVRKTFTNVVPLLLLVLSTWVFCAGCDRRDNSAQAQNTPPHSTKVPVTVVTVAPTTVRDVLVLLGESEAWQDVKVSAETGGLVEWMGPAEGAVVRKGELLAKIDVSTLEAALGKTQASFDLAEELYQRRQKLFERKIITREDRDQSRTQRTLAEGNLRQARIEYEKGFIRSPIDGIVNSRLAEAGEFVNRGTVLLNILNVERIKINVSVPEMDVRYMKKGQAALVTVDALPEHRLEGAIDFVSYKANPGTKTFLVRVIVANGQGTIRPGMICRVAFLRRLIPDAVVVPLRALVDKGGERMVFVEEDGVARARTVTLGVIEGDGIQVTQGVSPGERLIVTGQTEVEEGMKVRTQ